MTDHVEAMKRHSARKAELIKRAQQLIKKHGGNPAALPTHDVQRTQRALHDAGDRTHNKAFHQLAAGIRQHDNAEQGHYKASRGYA